jgi:hypothetical protein
MDATTMTHRSPEKLLEIIQTIASGILSPRKAAKRCGIPPSTYWDWISDSQKGDPRYLIVYCGEEMQFAKAVGLARRIALTDALGEFETRLLTGDETPVFYQGRPQWVEDEALSTFSDADLERLGIPDRWLRVNGRRVQHVLKTPPPIQAVAKMLEANFKQYRPRSEVQIDQKYSGGVTVVNVNKPVPALPVIEVVPPALPPPEREDQSGYPGNSVSDEPELIAEEPKAPISRRATGPISALEADLLQKLRQGPANPRPTALVQKFAPEPDDYDPNRTGSGPHAGKGTKLR